MPEHILFLTGKLAEPSLLRVLKSMEPTGFEYEVRQLGINVAALMTADMIIRRLKDIGPATRIMVPGHCRGDLEQVSQHFGMPVERGPVELKDLPAHFGRKSKPHDLSRHDVQIFAEIVDAPYITVEQIVAVAHRYRRDGAEVIDLGCLPATPFPHLTDAIQALKSEGFQVSVDSLDTADLIRGGKAGADYLLSLKEDTLWVADEVPSTPILIPVGGDDDASLIRAMETLAARGRRCIADSILDPIHTGFVESITGYRDLRRALPDAEIMMGIGNLTELTHADTAGATALLMGMISELRIGHVLTTEVSPHCRSVVRETDYARRLMYAAREDGTPPRLIDERLMTVHERRPYPYSAQEIQDMAAAIKDPSFRVQISADGLHVYNRDGLHTATDPYDLFPALGVETDGSHAFYLGVELARAEIAWQLGKRYTQDAPLDWGYARAPTQQDLSQYAQAGSTLQAKRNTKQDT